MKSYITVSFILPAVSCIPALEEVILVLKMTSPAPVTKILMEMIQVIITYNLHPGHRHCRWRVLFIFSAPRL